MPMCEMSARRKNARKCDINWGIGMPAIVETYSQSEKVSLDNEAIYLAVACLSLCMFAMALSLKFPSIGEAVALLS
jgi:hypothetical protein